MCTATSLVLHELLAESAHSGHIASCTEFYYHQSSSIYHNSFHLTKTAVAKWPFILYSINLLDRYRVLLSPKQFYLKQFISPCQDCCSQMTIYYNSINLLDRLLSNKSSSCYCYNPGCFLQVLLQSMNKKVRLFYKK